MEVSGLDSKNLERQALRKPSQDRYDDRGQGNVLVMRGFWAVLVDVDSIVMRGFLDLVLNESVY